MKTRTDLIAVLEALALEVELSNADAHSKAQKLAVLRGAIELCNRCPCLACVECEACKWRLKYRNATAEQVPGK